ncbi:Purine nucleoside phosphoramidase [Candidatus Erwinia haradaeae]|uniref:Purine nucleoside phosphoramidase n=1 Tax=Candidatus Erwinia haradaeae TaxID=1922217 RepID=A0A451CYQ0_9GAMM|nr:HIT domain-containing protein [Candidatus Erwinia haradaeae]VFP78486.1 Purine nucleoside phosphoramidase [Candidatus Erwinia haradaeae]
MPNGTIFSKIVKGEVFADIIYQDEYITAFRDILPQAPVHILIVPNVQIKTLNDVVDDDIHLLGRIVIVAVGIAKNMGIAEDGYRLIMNCNKYGGQEVYHIHLHLLGGQPLGSILGI